MSGFDSFTEKLERVIACSWRHSVFPRGGARMAPRSLLFSMEDSGCSWDYSFAIRIGDDWIMASRSVEPFEYDIFAPNGNGENRSYDNVASEIASGILSELRGKAAGIVC